MNGFINVKAYIRGEGIRRVNIGIENGRIVTLNADPAEITQLAETGNCLLAAGFIDEHIHGAGGADVMDATQSALETISQTLAMEGTTSFLATTMTQSGQKIKAALKNAASFKKCSGARCLGVHLEGPFISPEYIGAQSPEYVQKPSAEFFAELQASANGAVRMVTFAPEEDGAAEFLKYLNSQDVVASAGHSNATQSVVAEALKNGLSCVTHTYNAQRGIHHREIGVTGSALLYDGLACEVIADTVHVSVPALKLLIKNKPEDKLVLVTDSMRAKGAGDGVSELGGQAVYVKGGQAMLADGTLAGSVLKMNVAVKNLVTKCGVPLEQALDCASYNPAKNLGVEDTYGSIKAGAAADFTLLDNNFNVKLTVVGGNIVYSI